MKNKYFISIDSNNLGIYFSSAIITPHNYIKEPVDDIQSLNKDFILLSEKKFSNKSDCCLEVLLTEKEEESLISNKQSYYLFNSSLPITRISTIYFYSKQKMENTIDLARSSAYIPERLIKVVNKQNDDFFDAHISAFNHTKKADDISNKINLYNRYLGGFAFMKIGGENYMNYSNNYFSTLAFFNDAIKRETELAMNKDNINLNTKYQGLFNERDTEWAKWRKLVFGSHYDITSEIGIEVQTKNGVYQQNIVSADKKLYTLSVLANYGPDQVKSKKTESLLLAIISNEIRYRELITLFFGLNTGYSKIKKNYFIENKNWSMKFELASKLDYYTIESIFQLVFKNSNNSDFSFLTINIPENTKTKIDTRKYQTYKIIDENIIYDKKPTTISEIFRAFLNKNKLGKILSSLSNDFLKKNDIELNIKQNEKLQVKYFSIIEKPIKDYLQKLENEITELHIKQKTELNIDLNKFKKEYNQLSLLLRNADKTLFDEIDSNGDGELSQQEIGIFMDKIITAKKQLEAKVASNSAKHKRNNPISEYSSSNIISSQTGEYELGYNKDNNEIAIHRFYLNKLTVAELGNIAKSKSIILNKKEVNKHNSKDIIEKIIDNIKSKITF